jgi:rhodanese-related sulfurtransferase
MGNTSGDELPLEVDCQTVAARLRGQGEFVLIDCREFDEHAIARIAGSRLVPMSQLEARVGELTAHCDAAIAVHCHHGGRSLRVARWLREQGFAKAQSMAGGIDRWSIEIDPAVPRY